MNLQKKPPESSYLPCVACSNEQPDLHAERVRPHAATAPVADPEPHSYALSQVETENAGLRRLIVDLINENQQLRQQVSAAKTERSTHASAVA